MNGTFEEYKKQIFDFEYINSISTAGYSERLGMPDELSSAIGLICTAFQQLEEELSKSISRLIGGSPSIADILTAEMPFKNKAHLFASLVKHLHPNHHFNTIPGHDLEYINELVKSLFKSEELRNKVVHSIFTAPREREPKNWLVRTKKTAKANRGYIQTKEDLPLSYLLNIYDYTVSLTMELDQFLIDFERRE